MIGRLTRVVTLGAVLLLVAAPAAGSSSGKVGVHALIDTERYAGATCVYPVPPAPNFLRRLRVRPPVAYAVDRGAGTDRQNVGWRFRIQYTDTDPQLNDWHLQYTSPWASAPATDSYNAQWPDRSYVRGGDPLRGRYRAVVDIRWYEPASERVEGRATLAVQNYLVVEGTPQSTLRGNCQGTTG